MDYEVPNGFTIRSAPAAEADAYVTRGNQMV